MSFGTWISGTVNVQTNQSSEQRTVGVLDTGSSNIAAVMRSLSNSGFARELVPLNDIVSTQYDCVILPGVGNFGYVMGEMEKSGKAEWLRGIHQIGTPILGICLGAQLLFDSSEEAPGVKGLGFIPGIVKKLPSNELTRVPHMGWNDVHLKKPEIFEFQKLNRRSFYFAHSYFFVPKSNSDIVAEVNHGDLFCAIAGNQTCLAIQFHPEKSGRSGQELLRKGLEWLCQAG